MGNAWPVSRWSAKTPSAAPWMLFRAHARLRKLAARCDGDGHYDATCKDKAGKALGDDCDDNDALRFPGNIESCDADTRTKTATEDRRCQGLGRRRLHRSEVLQRGQRRRGAKLKCGDDCDDLKPSVNPHAAEICDLYDNDCDKKTDEGVATKQYVDGDFDGHGKQKSSAVMKCANTVVTRRWPMTARRRPESSRASSRSATAKDNNCNGKKDEVQDDAPWFVDADGDGFGDATSTPVYSCQRIRPRIVAKRLQRPERDDQSVAPSAATASTTTATASKIPARVNDFEDDDNDGLADAQCKGGTDCADEDPNTGKGKTEICDRFDNDCDGKIDEETDQTVWYLDRDGDAGAQSKAPRLQTAARSQAFGELG